MAVVDLDPGLTAAGPAAIAAGLADRAGEPLLVRLDAAALAAGPEADLRRWLRTVPFATLCVGDPPRVVRESVDAWVPDPDAADRLAAGFERAPLAALAATLLVRDPPVSPWAGLVAESTTYSLLQGGPEFAAWRERRPAPDLPDGAGDAGPRVRVSERHGHTVVTLTRGHKHNALDARTRDELDVALAGLAHTTGPVIVRGEGPSFCSGGDLDEFGSFPDPATAHVVRLVRSLAWRFHALERRLVVGLHGSCLGAGIELPAFAGKVIAADDARIGLPELGLGLVPGAGGTVSIPRRAGRNTLLQLLWDGGGVDARRARRVGLVDEVVPPVRLAERCHEVAETLR